MGHPAGSSRIGRLSTNGRIDDGTTHWFITGVSSGFGRELTTQLLERGDRVVGTVRDTGKVADLREQYPETFRAEELDVTDTAAIRTVIERAFAQLERIDVIISNAGYYYSCNYGIMRLRMVVSYGI